MLVGLHDLKNKIGNTNFGRTIAIQIYRIVKLVQLILKKINRRRRRASPYFSTITVTI